ncbi:YigZ family protein [Dorea acetigenes]|uniref:YigZ family protein n=1 Tax=Dorea acetigenes TaxID=2981787 RepID=A0ABT2RIH3_9FIRM|nr:YigZ family protein [Dorea acetigenes]MCU6685212.1 YigZ family protein [Dorea acetigenes]SCI40427.1 IMPACT family member yigZ [uncultured Clostridium sp.]
MLKNYRTVYQGGEGEIVEKKSRFIATVIPAAEEEEALAFIEAMNKKYWNATHNCFAYVIGERNEIQRCSDDGEPSGTAGKPMLDVLLGEELHNTAVVVTRYFGGTLLGTGGLVRAYSSAVKAGLASSVIITKKQGIKLEITTEYTGLGKIQYILAEKGMTVLDTLYTDKVEMTVLVPARELEGLKAAIMEGTNGRVRMEEGETCYYAEIEGKNRVLED